MKTLTIKDSTYEKLRAIKRKNESFSDLLDRLASEITNIEVLKKLRGTVEIEDKDKFLKEIYEKRFERR